VKISLPTGTAGLRSGITVAALGVVFGDIGTSPLYVLKTCFQTAHVDPTPANVIGILSLIVWALILVVCFKYVTVVMRITHDGEGGILALLALLLARNERGVPLKASWFVVVIVVGAAMLFGDGVITPAISILSAVEGLAVAAPDAEAWVVPVSLVLIVGLFILQARGTETVGRLFGPVMVLWFAAIAVAGAAGIWSHPGVLAAFDPRHAIGFTTHHGVFGFLVLGGVVLCVTGVEALYADLSHFGRIPITVAWYGIVFPAVTLNYLGQGARVLVDPQALANPFYALVSGPMLLPMILIATAATVIASQALISGAFTLTEQAIALNLCPRMEVMHTSNRYPGQVYVPGINAILGIACALLVLGFRSSDRLAAAYGLAVAVTMLATSIAFYLVVTRTFGWSRLVAVPLAGLFVAIDGDFVLAGLPKFLDGGFVPLALSICITMMSLTWLAGRRIVARSLAEQQESIEEFLHQTGAYAGAPPTGTMIFLTGDPSGVPFLGKHRWLRVRAQDERVVLLTLVRDPRPYTPDDGRVTIEIVDARLVRVAARFGYMEPPRIAPVFSACEDHGLALDDPETSFFYADPKIVAAPHGLPPFFRRLFDALVRVALPITDELQIPAERRVELGLEVAI
jgi:KUP system potassium uptake protein